MSEEQKGSNGQFAPATCIATQEGRLGQADSYNPRKRLTPPRFNFSAAESSGQELYSTMQTAVVRAV